MFYLFALSLCAEAKEKYAIMIDAGSSGTRAHIYHWFKTGSLPNVQPAPDRHNGWVLKSKVPLAKAAKNLSKIQEIFDPIIKFGVEKIPKRMSPETRIFVYATAGVRLLDEKNQEKVISNTFNYLKTHSPFKIKPRYVRAITGIEEGIYGWLSVNHLLGKFTKGQTTVGALDMGGASKQIAVQIDERVRTPSEHVVDLGYTRIKLFAHSYLGYGANEALKTVSAHLRGKVSAGETYENPCYPPGYTGEEKGYTINGTGKYDECVDLVRNVLIADESFSSVKIPEGTDEYVAMASFFYLNDFLKLPQNSTLKELHEASKAFCERKWSDIEAEYPDNSYVKTYCWYGTYQWAMMTYGYHFTDEKTKVFKAEDIDSVDLSWTIGAMLKEASTIEFDEIAHFSLAPIFLGNFIAFGIVFPLFFITERKKGTYSIVQSSKMV